MNLLIIHISQNVPGYCNIVLRLSRMSSKRKFLQLFKTYSSLARESNNNNDAKRFLRDAAEMPLKPTDLLHYFHQCTHCHRLKVPMHNRHLYGSHIDFHLWI